MTVIQSASNLSFSQLGSLDKNFLEATEVNQESLIPVAFFTFHLDNHQPCNFKCTFKIPGKKYDSFSASTKKQ